MHEAASLAFLWVALGLSKRSTASTRIARHLRFPRPDPAEISALTANSPAS